MLAAYATCFSMVPTCNGEPGSSGMTSWSPAWPLDWLNLARIAQFLAGGPDLPSLLFCMLCT